MSITTIHRGGQVRKFGGKQYAATYRATSRREADDQAKRQRKLYGDLVRVVKTGDKEYTVFVRTIFRGSRPI